MPIKKNLKCSNDRNANRCSNEKAVRSFINHSICNFPREVTRDPLGAIPGTPQSREAAPIIFISEPNNINKEKNNNDKINCDDDDYDDVLMTEDIVYSKLGMTSKASLANENSGWSSFNRFMSSFERATVQERGTFVHLMILGSYDAERRIVIITCRNIVYGYYHHGRQSASSSSPSRH